MYNTFFQLIRIALSVQDSFSHTPSPEEWQELYALAKKQSLVGICFAGVQQLPEDCRPPEDLYYKWMGMSAKIQHRNDVVNRQCVELQRRLREDGFRSCILKGQGGAKWYKETLPTSLKGRSSDRDKEDDDTLCKPPFKGGSEGLSMYRQSGDIDVWVEGSREEILAYINRICPTEEVGDLHAQFHVFEKTEVEVHFTPSILSNKKANKRLQEWFKGKKEECFGNENENSSSNPSSHHPSTEAPYLKERAGGEALIIPSLSFNLVFLLLHIFLTSSLFCAITWRGMKISVLAALFG